MSALTLLRTARVAYAGSIHQAVPHHNGLQLNNARQLTDGRVLAEADVVWLPPFEVGTIIALGINYADHAKELAKELTICAQDESLAFLKAPNSLVGHRGCTRRPADASFMHYECELAVVIGQTAKNVSRANAMAHVAGYTVANDYAIRDYLENWYRPNLRVKNRDGCTAERYATPMQALGDKVESLYARVGSHLKVMGFAWNCPPINVRRMSGRYRPAGRAPLLAKLASLRQAQRLQEVWPIATTAAAVFIG